MTWKKHFEKDTITIDHIYAALKGLYEQNAYVNVAIANIDTFK